MVCAEVTPLGTGGSDNVGWFGTGLTVGDTPIPPTATPVVPADIRELNYSAYFSEGRAQLPEEDYNSHNTRRLDEAEMAELLLKQAFKNVDGVANRSRHDDAMKPGELV